uniref:AT-rich interactive domain-containing protein 5B n=1 Tax=Geotrypetes seraphini TaxID=260995 RepID=A0A6P8QL16_GEOSA|nr:AT-rich interactive domain-containing protein 5B isoform X1 [Geotrypetes seraphini]
MEPNSLKWVGSPCGLHGPYMFYKAFQFHLEGRPRILSLGDFFFVRCKPADPICIAELQLLWEERTSKQLLSSSKLYFLPEDTPLGRNSDHGKDEVVAVSEKVIVRLEDLVKWAHSDFSKWKCGLRAIPLRSKEGGKNGQKECLLKYRQSVLNSGLNFKDVFKEKADLGEDAENTNVIVLSYPQYCRYRSMLKRIQAKSSLLANQFVLALGGIAVLNKNTQILYCRDTFDHPTLIENESICDEFAPNLKGRPRKKKPCPQRKESLHGVKDSCSNLDGKAVAKVKCEVKSALPKPKNNNCKKVTTEDKSKTPIREECRADEQAFLVALYKYMKERKTPIERIPYLGFKQINLWTMFQAAQKLGGYETITARRQWKNIYDELGGNPGSTSAATCTRRHYERLILPYERFLKGEEDKPLPPVKPRKQDNSIQEEVKARVPGVKRIRNETQKGKKEKENSQKSQEAFQVLSDHGKNQENLERSSVVQSAPEDLKKPTEEPLLLKSEMPMAATMEQANTIEASTERDKVKEEEEDQHLVPSLSSDLEPRKVEVDLEPSNEQLEKTANAISPTQQEMEPYTDHLDKEFHESPFKVFPAIQVRLPTQNHLGDEKLPEMPDYIANCTVKMDPLGNEGLQTPIDSNILQNALKQNPKVYLVQTLDVLKEKELPVSMNDNRTFSYAPVLYSRGNPGIMSPLAKKKLLSQVSGASLSSSSPYGSPPPLISKKKSNVREELPTAVKVSNSEPMAVNRPSVIQHVQSFKTKNLGDRKSTNDLFKYDTLSKPEVHRCDFSMHHLQSLTDSYTSKPDVHDCKDKMAEKKVMQHSQVPSFLTDFYSSPHLHRLYRQTEHHLHNEQTAKYLSQDMFRDSENISTFTQHKHPETINLNYHSSLHQPEKKVATDISIDDQPTDLSLPKSTHKQFSKMVGSNISHSVVQQEIKSTPPLQTTSSQRAMIAGCHPKACRVFPMPLAPKKHSEAIHRPGKSQNMRLDGVRKMEGVVHPIISRKSSCQNVGTARPLKRSLEDMDSMVSEKKARALSPMHPVKELSIKEKFPEQEGEGSKSAHGTHTSVLDNHKFPLSSPIFPGLYSGTLCTGLNSRIPAAYSHPLQYLKNQTVLSPLMQPLSLYHSIAMQRQFLASSANSGQLYRHLATAAPMGASYSDLLHSTIYPLTPINPQAAFQPSQLSSVHPSTKL